MIKLYNKYKEVIMYLIFGVLTTLISIGSYIILTKTILNYENPLLLQVANVLSWTIAVIFAYVTNRKFVFQSKNKKGKEFISFIAARIITLLMDMAIMGIFVSILHFDNQIMKIISQIVVIVANYIFSKIFVFVK